MTPSKVLLLMVHAERQTHSLISLSQFYFNRVGVEREGKTRAGLKPSGVAVKAEEAGFCWDGLGIL